MDRDTGVSASCPSVGTALAPCASGPGGLCSAPRSSKFSLQVLSVPVPILPVPQGSDTHAPGTHVGHAVLDLGALHLRLELCEVQVGLAVGPAERPAGVGLGPHVPGPPTGKPLAGTADSGTGGQALSDIPCPPRQNILPACRQQAAFPAQKQAVLGQGPSRPLTASFTEWPRHPRHCHRATATARGREVQELMGAGGGALSWAEGTGAAKVPRRGQTGAFKEPRSACQSREMTGSTVTARGQCCLHVKGSVWPRVGNGATGWRQREQQGPEETGARMGRGVVGTQSGLRLSPRAGGRPALSEI